MATTGIRYKYHPNECCIMGLWSSIVAWVKNEPTKLTLKAVPSTPVGQTVVLTGKLFKVRTMAAIPNATVVVTVTPPSGTAWTASKVTDANGAFSVPITLSVVGTYAIKADYAGEPNKYKPSSATTSIVALAVAAPTTLTLTPSSPQANVGDTVTVQATLTG